MKVPNGWKKAIYIAAGIATFGAALAVLEPFTYSVWAPKITLAIAAENKLIRLDSELILLETLEAQAEAVKNWAKVQRMKVRIKSKEREIKELETLKAKHE